MGIYRRLSDRLQANADRYGPIDGSLSLGRMGFIWLAANLVVTTMLTGTLFVPGMPWATTIVLIFLGSLLGGIVLVLVGNIGTRTGLPTMSVAKGALGLRGAWVAVAANVIILMGWSWVQAMLAGLTVDYLVHSATGYSNPMLFAVLCQVLVIGLAIFGHEGIAKVEPWLGVAILACMGYVYVVAFTDLGLEPFLSLAVEPELGWTRLLVLDVVIATAISWTVLSADLNRLAGSQTAGIVGSGSGYVLSTTLSMSLGATAIAYVVISQGAAPSFDPTVLVANFGVPLAFVIFFSVMATNTMVMYGMVSSVINAAPLRRLEFLPCALVLGAISIVGATWFQLLDQFTNFLALIGTLFIPLFAIMIVDYYVAHRGDYSEDILLTEGGRYWYQEGWHTPALTIWAIGAFASLAFNLFIPSPVGASIATFVIAFGLYLAWTLANRSRQPA